MWPSHFDIQFNPLWFQWAFLMCVCVLHFCCARIWNKWIEKQLIILWLLEYLKTLIYPVHLIYISWVISELTPVREDRGYSPCPLGGPAADGVGLWREDPTDVCGRILPFHSCPSVSGSQASDLEPKVTRLSVWKKKAGHVTGKGRARESKIEPTSPSALPPITLAKRTFRVKWPLLLSCVANLTHVSFQSVLTRSHTETLENILAALPSWSSAKSPQYTHWKHGSCSHH